MKKFIQTIKDNLYDSVDWIIMGAIVFLVIGFIGWRLDILFAKDKSVVDEPKKQITVENNTDEQNNTPNTDTDANANSLNDAEQTQGEPTHKDNNETNNPTENTGAQSADKTAMDIEITIPSGSSSDKIANILYDGGAISSVEDFTKKVNERNLATKLKAGTFKIPAGSSTDDVITIISK